MKKAKVLEALGFRKDWIYETIISTYSGAKAHSAPMGICTRDLESVVLEAYKTSQTCKNIVSGKCFTINFTSEIELFYKSLWEKEALFYGKAKTMDAPFLKGADAFIEIKVLDETDLGDRIGFACQIVSLTRTKEPVRLVNRADALALECLIAASKIPHLCGGEKEFLKEEITYILRAVSKAAPGSQAELLVEKVCSETR